MASDKIEAPQKNALYRDKTIFFPSAIVSAIWLGGRSAVVAERLSMSSRTAGADDTTIAFAGPTLSE